MTQELWIQPIPVGKNHYGVEMVAVPVKCQACGCEFQHDFVLADWARKTVDELYQVAYMTPLCPICWQVQRRAAFRFNQRVTTPFGEGRVVVPAEKISVDVGESTFVLPGEQVTPLEPSDPEKAALVEKIRWLEEQMDIHRQALADAQADVIALKEERDALRESLTEARAEIGKRVLAAEQVNKLFVPETYFFAGPISSERSANDTAERLTAMRRQGWTVAYEKIVVGDGMSDYYARLEREVERDAMPDPIEEYAAVPVPVVSSKRRVSGAIIPSQPPSTAPQNFEQWQREQDAQIMASGREAYERFKAQFPRRPFSLIPGAAK